MIQYKDFAPTGFDSKGAFLEERQDWWVCPVSQNRDSDALDESNFAACLEMLGGEQEDLVEVHRFGHWGPGWFEIIICHPSLESKVQEIEDGLECYPVLDEGDLSRREEEDYQESWNNYGRRDFVHDLRDTFRLASSVVDALLDVDGDILREFFEEIAPERYITESSGVCIRTRQAAQRCTREELATFLREVRRDRARINQGKGSQVSDI